MLTESLAKAFQFAGPVFDALLCAVMVRKKRWQDFPALFCFIVIDFLSSFALYGIDSTGRSAAYTYAYFAFDIASSLAQLFIVYEIARNVLKPTGVWVREAFRPLSLVAFAGAAVAGIATWLLPNTGLQRPAFLQLRAEVFTALLTCEIVIAMFSISRPVGLGWRNHVMAVGQGMMFWLLIGAAETGFALYLGPRSPVYGIFYYVRSMSYFSVVIFWCVSLWRSEPERKPVSPFLRKYVLALHDRVRYDLGQAGH